MLPRFLTYCKIRYLPELDFGTDYGETDYFRQKLLDDPVERRRIAAMTEAEFFEREVDPYGIFG